MHYRFGEKPPARPHRQVQNLSTRASLHVNNGTIFYASYPCFYQEIHEPLPMRYTNLPKGPEFRQELNKADLVPIRFKEEMPDVYCKTKVVAINGDPVPAGTLTLIADIRDEQDNIIDLTVKPYVANAQLEPQQFFFTVYVIDDTLNIKQVALNGLITVHPALI